MAPASHQCSAMVSRSILRGLRLFPIGLLPLLALLFRQTAGHVTAGQEAQVAKVAALIDKAAAAAVSAESKSAEATKLRGHLRGTGVSRPAENQEAADASSEKTGTASGSKASEAEALVERAQDSLTKQQAKASRGSSISEPKTLTKEFKTNSTVPRQIVEPSHPDEVLYFMGANAILLAGSVCSLVRQQRAERLKVMQGLQQKLEVPPRRNVKDGLKATQASAAKVPSRSPAVGPAEEPKLLSPRPEALGISLEGLANAVSGGGKQDKSSTQKKK